MPFSDLVLNTKLYIPQSRSSLVVRPNVLGKLEQGLTRAVTLVSAPAGFGKTTLLSEWYESKAGKMMPLAWLSLDPEDNDIARFLLYLAASLATLEEGISDSVFPLLQMNQPPAPSVILTSLINKLTETLPSPFILVLDDYHVITSPAVQDALLFVTENLPPQMHIVILTREDPRLPLARLRVRQQLTEIRAADLRFSLEESAAFLNQIMGLDLAANEVETLETRTEGWIAGLQMAAISMQGREDKSNFIHTFASSHRFIFDYLIEEVLERQTPEIQDFLVKTSILDRMCAPLCDAVTGKSDSQGVLIKLELMNLFVIPLDDQRTWYRYHHLFSDLLFLRLKELDPDTVATLHLQASYWYEANNLLADAINHAFAVGDISRVAQLAETNILGIINRGELATLIKWLDGLPEKLIDDYPWLRVSQAWALSQAGSFDEAKQGLASAETSLQEGSSMSEEQTRHIHGHIAAIRLYIEVMSIGNYTQATQFAHKALKYLPKNDLRTRGMVNVFLGAMYRNQKELSFALDTLNSALAIYRDTNQKDVIVDILSQIARVRNDQGLLHDAAQLCQEAINTADLISGGGLQNRLPVAGYAMGILGRIYYEWNQMDKAIEIGAQALRLSERWGQANNLLGNHLFLAKIYRVQGKFEQALASVQAAKKISGHISDTHAFVIGTHEAVVRLAMGEIRAAEQWVKYDSARYETNQDERVWELAPLILALYRENQVDSLDELLFTLDKLLKTFDEKGIHRRSVKANIQKAVVFKALKDYDRALVALEKALSKAEPEGFVRSFIDQGAPMENLLKIAIAKEIRVGYANQLLTAIRGDKPRKVFSRDGKSIPMIEDLTRRELEVLRLLNTELPIPEIAGELVLSIETVRTHIKRIYRKLDAHSRFEAVTKSKQLNLL